jgi:hypothetical protein
MLSLDDKRWSDLKGGHRTRFDPRPLLLTLETDRDVKTVCVNFGMNSITKVMWARLPMLLCLIW